MSRMQLIFGALLLVAVVIPCTVWATEHFLRPQHGAIDHRYFKCESVRALEGGIYGKGPFKRFGSTYCRGWVEINRQEFKRLAQEWYGYKWDKEIPFWQDQE